MFTLAALSLLLASYQEAPTSPRAIPPAYEIIDRPDGTSYLGSPILIDRGEPDLSALLLDQAVNLTPDAIEHVATGLRVPLRAEDCTLEWFAGVPVGQWSSVEKGGRAYYVCDPTEGPAFVIVTFEANFSGFGLVPDAARRLAIAGMAMAESSPGKDDVQCDSKSEDGLTVTDCLSRATIDEQPIYELGRVVVRGKSFLKANVACLESQCELARDGLDRLISAFDVKNLRAEAANAD